MRVDAAALRRFLVSSLLLAAAMPAWVPPARAGVFADFGVQVPGKSLPAPDFTLPRLDGGSLSLSDLRGRVVILHFWATWCDACRQEMPQIQALWMHHRKEIMVLGINVDRGDRSDIARFVQALHIDFPSVLDAAGDARRRYHIRALPTSYLIDGDGKIMGRIIGERDWDSPAARNLINRLTGQQGAAPIAGRRP